MSSWAVGVSVGGASLRAAAVDPTGRVLDAVHRPVEWAADPTRPFAQLVTLVEQVVRGRARTPPAGVGVGATGPVDPVTGVIDDPRTMPPSMRGDVREALRGYALVAVENEADVAAVAEARFGAGRGLGVTACITVGMSIGVGVVQYGRIFRGALGAHPEAGHHIVDPSGPLCYCGAHGCVESLASGPALTAAAEAAGLTAATTAELFSWADAGDPTAAQIVDRAHRALRAAARNLIALHAPDVIVFTGSAVGPADRLVSAAQRDADRFPYPPPPGTRITASSMDDLAGCAGAASLVLFP